MKAILQVFSFDLVSKALLGVTGILLIRFMAPGEYAQYTLAVSLIMVVTQAFTTSSNRLYIVGHKKLGLKGSSSPFLGFQLAGITILSLMALPFLKGLNGIYWFVAAAVVATCFSEFAKTFFQEKMRFLRFSFIELGRTSTIALGVMAAILIMGHDLAAWQVLLIQAGAMAFVFIIFFGRRLEIAALFQFNDVISLASKIIRGKLKYLFGYFFLFAFFGQMDIFMLRSLAGDKTLAAYGSAFRYYTLVILALGSVHAVLLPITQNTEAISKLRETYRRYMKLVLIFAPVILLGAWASQWIIPAIDAGKYPEAVMIFRILAVSSIISIAFSPYVNLVMKFEGFRFLFFLVSGAIGMSIGLNLILVPRFGAVGTAISTMISFALVNGLTFHKGRRMLTHFERSLAITSSDASNIVGIQPEPANIGQAEVEAY